MAYPNKAFVVPANKSWFEVDFIPPNVDAVGMYEDSQDMWSGIFQIAICTPLNKGEDEADNKYLWIAKLFSRGKTFEDINIRKCSKVTVTAENDHYRTVVRVEWDAVIDKE